MIEVDEIVVDPSVAKSKKEMNEILEQNERAKQLHSKRREEKFLNSKSMLDKIIELFQKRKNISKTAQNQNSK